MTDGLADLEAFVADLATEHAVPGVAVGFLQDDTEHFVVHGVTSVDHPLPVTPETIFHIGSVTKTMTATAVVRLVERGELDLDAPVRTYLPDFRVADADVSAAVTTRHLLTHTAGWGAGFFTDSGEGDDALAGYVERMSDVEQIAPLGARSSYCNAGVCVVGRVVEAVTGQTYEQAVADLLLTPLGMTRSTFFANEAMTHRFASGHRNESDGSVSVARPWRAPRGANPGGGLSSTVADLLRWARFHLGDGRAPGGERLLSEAALGGMQSPLKELVASALGDAIGTSWFLREVDGVQLVGHGGSTSGHYSEFLMVPERGFALAVVSNSEPNSLNLNQAVVRRLLADRLGLDERPPEPLPYDEARSGELVGTYEDNMMWVHVRSVDEQLAISFEMKPEALAEMGQEVPDYPPCPMGLLPRGDEYILTGGPFGGMRGYFSRDEHGDISGVDLSGRLYGRLPASAGAR
jgi:CubicO group peptidase (beta-lactamase class C family)